MEPVLIVFDVDGTLIDSQAMIQAAMERAFGAAGIPAPSLGETRAIVGLSLPEAMAQLAPSAGPDAHRVLVSAYKNAFAEERAETLAPLFPGALDALERLSARDEVLLGLATGKSRRGLAHVLEAHRIEWHFVTRQVADDHPSKPHPSMLLAALAETGADARRAVMIGDTTFDIAMARAAGVAALGVAWGYHPVQSLCDAGARAIAPSFEELDALIDAAIAAAEEPPR